VFALVDCNSFFASCEQVFRPDLRGQPLVVLSNNDGCIVARSKEAKLLGIPDLVPYFKVRDELKKHGVHVFSSNYELYGDMSHRVMRTLELFSPDIEIYSIDEAFLSLQGMTRQTLVGHLSQGESLPAYAHRIRQTVRQHTGLAVGIGVGPTKTLAKLASYIAKHSRRCNHVCVIEQPQSWMKVFAKIPVRKIWGIGSRISARLALLNVHSVSDLLKQEPKQMRKLFGINMLRTLEELNGTVCYRLNESPAPKKQIFSTRSFGQKITECVLLEQAVSQYARRACAKLRKQHALVKTMLVFASSGYSSSPAYSRSTVIHLPYATNDTRMVAHAARQAIREGIFREGVRFAKAGVGLIEIQAERPEQLDVFQPVQTERSKKLMAVMDRINMQYGPLFFASEGINQAWKMQRNLKSPAYTTRWQDLPKVWLR
jgi:DNA polymerase V